jgi:hypothetical protein
MLLKEIFRLNHLRNSNAVFSTGIYMPFARTRFNSSESVKIISICCLQRKISGLVKKEGHGMAGAKKKNESFQTGCVAMQE